MTTLDQTAPSGEDWVLDSDDGVAATTTDGAAADAGADQSAVDANAGATPEPTEIEKLAMEIGWVPKDRWPGDPAGHKDAASFIRFSKHAVDNANKRARESKSQFDMLQQELRGIKQQVHGVTQAQQAALQANYDEAIENLETARFEARKEGDQAAYDKLTKQQRDLEKEFRPKLAQAPSADPGDIDNMSPADAAARADELMSDPIASAFFTGQNGWVLGEGGEQGWNLFKRAMDEAAHKGATPIQQFRHAEEALKWAFPKRYEAPRNTPERDPETGRFRSEQEQPQRRAPAPVAEGQRTPNAGRGNIPEPIAKLPAEARTFLKSQMDAGKIKDQAGAIRWAKVYLGEKVNVLD